MPDLLATKAALKKTLGVTAGEVTGDTQTATFTGKTLTAPGINGTITTVGDFTSTLDSQNYNIRRTGSGAFGLEIGSNDATGGNCLIDLHTDSGDGDYRARIRRFAGTNGSLDFFQTGTGSINFIGSVGTPIDFTGGILRDYRLADAAKTGAYTVVSDDTVIRVDGSASAFTITLQAAASAFAGRVLVIIRIDQSSSTNAITIDGNASETIGGNLTHTLWPAETLIIECDGSNWVILEAPEVAGYGYHFNKGATANRRYIAGLATNMQLLTSTTGPTVDLLYAMPLYVAKSTKFDAISYELTTQGASSQVRLGVYRDNGNCYPGSLIFDSGNVTGTNPIGEKTATITAASQIFQSGLYWLTYCNSATIPQIRCMPGAGSMFPILGLGTPFGANLPSVCYTAAHTATTALPATYPASATLRNAVSAVGSPIPAVALRAV